MEARKIKEKISKETKEVKKTHEEMSKYMRIKDKKGKINIVSFGPSSFYIFLYTNTTNIV
jgi:ABC-type enterochelin transport system substrate-binding protein